jgi:hypothetical protein
MYVVELRGRKNRQTHGSKLKFLKRNPIENNIQVTGEVKMIDSKKINQLFSY